LGMRPQIGYHGQARRPLPENLLAHDKRQRGKREGSRISQPANFSDRYHCIRLE